MSSKNSGEVVNACACVTEEHNLDAVIWESGRK